MTAHSSDQPELEFSLATGGPFYRFLVRLRLERPPVDLARRRALACVALTWLPLLLVTLASGTLLHGPALPFVSDLGVHIKFLVGVPLFLAGEVLIHTRIDAAVREFVERGLVTPSDELRFRALVARAMRLRSSALVEATLFAVVFIGGHYLWRNALMLRMGTWYATTHDGRVELTSAGYWYAFVSLPFARFLLFRWYFRMAVWYSFLWRVARLRLNLDALHPDRAGGLGFLEHTATAFAPALLAQSAMASGTIATRILSTGAKLVHFQFQIGGIIALLVLLGFLPLTFFVSHIVQTKWKVDYAFGSFATQYTREFSEKWLDGTRPSGEPLLGSADIQSLADLGNSFSTVSEMRWGPFRLAMVLRLAVLVAVPFSPLVLTMIPLKQLLLELVKLVF